MKFGVFFKNFQEQIEKNEVLAFVRCLPNLFSERFFLCTDAFLRLFGGLRGCFIFCKDSFASHLLPPRYQKNGKNALQSVKTCQRPLSCDFAWSKSLSKPPTNPQSKKSSHAKSANRVGKKNPVYSIYIVYSISANHPRTRRSFSKNTAFLLSSQKIFPLPKRAAHGLGNASSWKPT